MRLIKADRECEKIDKKTRTQNNMSSGDKGNTKDGPTSTHLVPGVWRAFLPDIFGAASFPRKVRKVEEREDGGPIDLDKRVRHCRNERD